MGDQMMQIRGKVREGSLFKWDRFVGGMHGKWIWRGPYANTTGTTPIRKGAFPNFVVVIYIYLEFTCSGLFNLSFTWNLLPQESEHSSRCKLFYWTCVFKIWKKTLLIDQTKYYIERLCLLANGIPSSSSYVSEKVLFCCLFSTWPQK